MGGCQNYGPFLGTLNIRCRTIMGIQKETIILTTTHIGYEGTVLIVFQACTSFTKPYTTLSKPSLMVNC